MKKLLLSFIIFFAVTNVFAGDVATLVNLGFSADSAYFMFGFYGTDTSTNAPYSQIFIVDTKKNNFVTDGVYKLNKTAPLKMGNDPSGAFYKLFADAIQPAKKYNIDFLNQGRLVYLLVNGEDNNQSISFTDPDGSALWKVTINKTIDNTKADVVSSFDIDLSITTGDKTKTSKVGSQLIKRSGVSDYAIRQILVAPDNKTVVFLIEKREKELSGVSIRYMVETVRLP